jgi:hypothetical protein
MRTNRSKIESWFNCPRYRYLRYHAENGRGLSKVIQKAPANLGQMIHTINAAILTGRDVEVAIAHYLHAYALDFPKGIPFCDEQLQEHLTFIEGVVRAFNLVRFPQLKQMGTIIAVEQEKPFQLATDITVDWKADFILETAEEMIIVGDFKPTPYGNYQFVKKWERNHQICTYVAGAQNAYPTKPILGVQIEGYAKGKRQFDDRLFNGEMKIQNSPLCYVYENQVTGQISPEYQRSGDWKKVPLWETSLSSKEYIEDFLTPIEVEKLFLAPIPPICPTPQQIASWKRQTVANERKVDNMAEAVNLMRKYGEIYYLHMLDECFPQNMSQCDRYGADYPCEMESICFNHEVFADPLASGLYEETIDHHNFEED